MAQDTVGWPTYVRQIGGVYATVSPTQRSRTVVVTSNYGEAGAVVRYGERYQLPAVYSGHNQLYYQGRPPETATRVILVGGQLEEARPRFETCDVVDRLDNGLGVDNEEQGQPIAICAGPSGGWVSVWPSLQHED